MNALNDWLEQQWAISAQEFSVMVQGAAIACRGWNLAATDLPGIVLVHGFRAHAGWWDHIAPALAQRFRVVAMSFSGMGDSDRREHYSRGQFGCEITSVAQACGFDPAIVIAHSFGAVPALLAAHAQPDAIARLIVIDGGMKTPDEEAHMMVHSPRKIYPSQQAVMNCFRLIPEWPWPVPKVQEYIACHSVRQDDDGWTWKFDANQTYSLNEDADGLNLLQVAIPVDVILGEHTSIMVPKRVAELARLAPGLGDPVVIPASEHHVMIDQPVALVSALRGLLANDRRALR